MFRFALAALFALPLLIHADEPPSPAAVQFEFLKAKQSLAVPKRMDLTYPVAHKEALATGKPVFARSVKIDCTGTCNSLRGDFLISHDCTPAECPLGFALFVPDGKTLWRYHQWSALPTAAEVRSAEAKARAWLKAKAALPQHCPCGHCPDGGCPAGCVCSLRNGQVPPVAPGAVSFQSPR